MARACGGGRGAGSPAGGTGCRGCKVQGAARRGPAAAARGAAGAARAVGKKDTVGAASLAVAAEPASAAHHAAAALAGSANAEQLNQLRLSTVNRASPPRPAPPPSCVAAGS